MGRSLTPVEIGVRRLGNKVYLEIWLLSVYEAGSEETFAFLVVHINTEVDPGTPLVDIITSLTILTVSSTTQHSCAPSLDSSFLFALY